jgi:hypothetical protein
MSAEKIFCTNHPQTETLLRCIQCGKPYCVKCLVRTPVGNRCRTCLNQQQAGFYTALPSDYLIVTLVGSVVSIIGGAIGAALGGIWLIAIFYGPFAGGIIAEAIRRTIQKRRGKYIWLAACVTVVIGGFIGAGFPFLFSMFSRGFSASLFLALPFAAMANIFNLGFLIYLALAVSTVYARLR